MRGGQAKPGQARFRHTVRGSNRTAAWIGRWARLMPAIIVVSVNRVYTNNGSNSTG